MIIVKPTSVGCGFLVKKGIKTEQDIINDRKKFENKKSNKKLFDYDWLNERDS